jgi:hypothetical protein
MTKLTTSEARAEACIVLLKLMLEEMGRSRRRRLKRAARKEGLTIGHPMVIEEIDWLFWQVR